MDTAKGVVPPTYTICFLWFLLCNTCDVTSFVTQNTKQMVQGDPPHVYQCPLVNNNLSKIFIAEL